MLTSASGFGDLPPAAHEEHIIALASGGFAVLSGQFFQRVICKGIAAGRTDQEAAVLSFRDTRQGFRFLWFLQRFSGPAVSRWEPDKL